MIEHKKGKLIFLSYKLFDRFEYITNIISTRLGGLSRGPYSSLNVGLHVKDRNVSVIENRRRLCIGLGIESVSLTSCKQIHGSNVSIVNSKNKGKGAFEQEDAIDSCDGLITSLEDVPLLILIADCIPLSFFDPIYGVIGLVHGSWRGTLQGIAQKTVYKMKEEFGCHPEDIIVGIGPSIGPCCYEVKEDVIEQFNKAFPGEADSFLIKNKKDAAFLDLWTANFLQLQETGIKKENIELSGICTSCNSDLFYSYRAKRGETGRFCGLICLHKKTKRSY
ncbi:MAG: peptidoglycan editing factor PgeF [Thermodesulfobacteriota bacterium]|nr:peptidoglycan editing factor PgeF [Thermodesulfobacteriota bacterium]